MATAALTAAAALGLTLFFFAAKHQHWLARFVPFAEDPYDAVGSFSFQLALAAAAASLLRALRRYGGAGIPPAQAALVLRGSIVALLAVFITMQADALALLRHQRGWARSPLGAALALGVGVVAAASLGSAGLLGPAARRMASGSRASWQVGVLTAAAAVALLAVYPESWRRSVPGAIGAVIVGMAVLFGETWGLMLSIAPPTPAGAEDLLDDLHGVFGGETGAPARWLRASPWRVAASVAALGGGIPAATQAIGEGLPGTASRALLVLGIYAGFEALAILTAFALFRRPLALLGGRGGSLAPAPAKAPENP